MDLALVLNQLTLDIACAGLSSPANGLYIHGPAGVTQTTAILVDLSPYNGGAFSAAGSLGGTVTPTASQPANLVDQLMSVGFHTDTSTNGELRGHLLRQSEAGRWRKKQKGPSRGFPGGAGGTN